MIPQTPQVRRGLPTWIDSLAICLIVAAAFGRLVTADFSSWDDQYNIWQNPNFNPPTLSRIAYYWQNPAYSLYIPLTYTVWGALAAVSYLQTPDQYGSHLNPWVFHAANVALHAVNSILVYRIIRRLLTNRPGAVVGALLFGLHPIQVEAVGWAAGLKDVLFSTLSLVALLQYVQFVQESSGWRWALATLALVGAMLSKPTAMVVPAMAFVIDWLLLRRPPRAVIRWMLPWAVLSLACAVVARLVQSGFGIAAPPVWVRPLVAADAVAFYLAKLVWPIHLGIDYGRRPETIMASGAIYWTWLLPAALALLLYRIRANHRVLIVAALLFLIPLSPVLGFFPFLFQYYSTTADHYVYLAMIGPALAAAYALTCVSRRSFHAVAAAILLLLAGRAVLQSAVWQNDEVLFSHALNVNPDSFMARGNLAHTLLFQDQPARAERYLIDAIRLKPDYWQAEQNLGEAYARQGRFDQAVMHRKQALSILLSRPQQIRADIAPVLNALSYDLIQANRLDEAALYIAQALANRPDDALAQENQRLLDARRASTSQPAK